MCVYDELRSKIDPHNIKTQSLGMAVPCRLRIAGGGRVGGAKRATLARLRMASDEEDIDMSAFLSEVQKKPNLTYDVFTCVT